MGITKSEHFTDHQNELANVLKALGHPARVAIVEYLIQHKQCICGDIVNELPLSQATISQHLRELKRAGLIDGRIFGVKSKYWIDKDNFEKFKKDFSNFSSQINIDVTP